MSDVCAAISDFAREGSDAAVLTAFLASSMLAGRLFGEGRFIAALMWLSLGIVYCAALFGRLA